MQANAPTASTMDHKPRLTLHITHHSLYSSTVVNINPPNGNTLYDVK
mgnify:CR=1 FL=1